MEDTIGARIKKARLETLTYRRMSQAELAKMLNCNTSSVRNWEHDRVVPGNDVLKKIAQICNVDWRWLLLGDGTNDKTEKNRVAFEMQGRLTEWDAELQRYVVRLYFNAPERSICWKTGETELDASRKIVISKEPDALFGGIIDRLAMLENEKEGGD